MTDVTCVLVHLKRGNTHAVIAAAPNVRALAPHLVRWRLSAGTDDAWDVECYQANGAPLDDARVQLARLCLSVPEEVHILPDDAVEQVHVCGWDPLNVTCVVCGEGIQCPECLSSFGLHYVHCSLRDGPKRPVTCQV